MDRMIWRYGDTNPVQAPVGRDTIIELGDLVWLNGNQVKPFTDSTWGSFDRYFLGVAMQRSRSLDTSDIRVATSGVFEFSCLSNVWQLGRIMRATGNQSVEKAITLMNAVGRVARYERTPVTSVLVDIQTRVMGPV